jgi:WD40 repeat protein
MAWSPDGTELAVAGTRADLVFWNLEERQPVESQRLPAKDISAIAYSADGAALALGTKQGEALFFHRRPFRLLGKVQFPYTVIQLAFAADGNTLFAQLDHNGIRSLGTADAITLQLTPDRVEERWHAPHLPLAANSFALGFLAPPGAVHLQPLWDRAPMYAVSRDGSYLAAHCQDDDILSSWNLREGRRGVDFGGLKKYVYGLCLSPDGRTVATYLSPREIQLWSTQTGRALISLDPHLHIGSCIDFSPDGRFLVAIGVGYRHREELVVWEGLP